MSVIEGLDYPKHFRYFAEIFMALPWSESVLLLTVVAIEGRHWRCSLEGVERRGNPAGNGWKRASAASIDCV